MSQITLKRVMVYKGGSDAMKAAKKIKGMHNGDYNILYEDHDVNTGFSSQYYPLMLDSDKIYDANGNIVNVSDKNPASGNYTFSYYNAILALKATPYDSVGIAVSGASAKIYAHIGWGNPGKPIYKDLERFATDGEISLMKGSEKPIEHQMSLTRRYPEIAPTANDYLLVSHDDAFKFFFLTIDDKEHSGFHKIHFNGDTYLMLVFTFTYEGPSANEFTDFKIEQVKDSSGKDDVSSRKLSFSWTEQGYKNGQAPFKEMKTVGKASFEIYDVGDSTKVDDSNQILVYKTDSVSKKKKTSPTTVEKYAAIYGVNRPYRIYERLFDSSGTLIAGVSTKYAGIIAPTPAVMSSPATKLVGNTSSEEDLYDQISTGSVLTDQSVTLKWTNPTISHAEGFRVNYEIMFSTDGKTFKHLDYVYSDKNKCPTVQNGKTILSNQPESGADQYVNKYVIDKTILNANNIKNYDRVYVGVKIVISKNYNDPITYYDKTRTLSQTKQEMTSMNQDMIENFICVYECNVHYCPDGFTWRKCLVYYCPNGEKWVPVVLRWSPTGDHWVYC